MNGPSFFDFIMGQVRLSVLRTLVELATHVANDSLLFDAMRSLGLPINRDQLRTQLAWLDEQGLIRLGRNGDTVLVASLRERGADVAMGLASIDGVPRPNVGR